MASRSNPECRRARGAPALRPLLGGAAWAAAAASALAAPLEVTVADAQGRPLAEAVVFLESPAARAASRPLPAAEIVQQNRRFVPEVSVVTVGTAVAFPNRDTVRHHVFSFSPTKRFEIKLYVGSPAAPVVFDRPGISVLGCNIHDEMAAWVVIVETPWYARTDAQGRARLPDVPAGAYQLRTWHPGFVIGSPALQQGVMVGSEPLRVAVRTPG